MITHRTIPRKERRVCTDRQTQDELNRVSQTFSGSEIFLLVFKQLCYDKRVHLYIITF
ncbi:hypothetical protein PBCV1_a620aR [Paramecium bursaria Chlorella virus 1]|uniref:Uncharacterized protein n=1 Tax=Paramecium bursaria Chlorella virus 1 TaxID=10506 RepID=F8TU69_PBCV1|nr:hypothetical protein PBCV1_a620aR [Paramecium bursaria Chlorella virus 1]AEI70130.1 hypothetical protein [Paramecium bursaria Chlorella virus 1]